MPSGSFNLGPLVNKPNNNCSFLAALKVRFDTPYTFFGVFSSVTGFKETYFSVEQISFNKRTLATRLPNNNLAPLKKYSTKNVNNAIALIILIAGCSKNKTNNATEPPIKLNHNKCRNA